eukprot:2614467-Amphidinium_carterae.1
MPCFTVFWEHRCVRPYCKVAFASLVYLHFYVFCYGLSGNLEALNGGRAYLLLGQDNMLDNL